MDQNNAFTCNTKKFDDFICNMEMYRAKPTFLNGDDVEILDDAKSDFETPDARSFVLNQKEASKATADRKQTEILLRETGDDCQANTEINQIDQTFGEDNTHKSHYLNEQLKKLQDDHNKKRQNDGKFLESIKTKLEEGVREHFAMLEDAVNVFYSEIDKEREEQTAKFQSALADIQCLEFDLDEFKRAIATLFDN